MIKVKVGMRFIMRCFKSIQKYQGDFEVVFILKKDEVEPRKAKNWPSDKVFLMPVLESKVSEDMSRCVETWSHVLGHPSNDPMSGYNRGIDQGAMPVFWAQKGLIGPKQWTLANMRGGQAAKT